jgi:hypothetical protein
MTLYHNPETRLFETVKDVEDMPANKVDQVIELLRSTKEPLRYIDLMKLVQEEMKLSEQHAKLMIAKAIDSKLICKDKGKRGLYRVAFV